MNGLTKSELKIILLEMDIVIHRTNKQGILKISPIYFELRDKIQSLIDNYWLPDNVDLIGTGQLLFHNKESSSAIIPKIANQLDLCENNDEMKAFRIDWKIIYGKKFGQ